MTISYTSVPRQDETQILASRPHSSSLGRPSPLLGRLGPDLAMGCLGMHRLRHCISGPRVRLSTPTGRHVKCHRRNASSINTPALRESPTTTPLLAGAGRSLFGSWEPNCLTFPDTERDTLAGRVAKYQLNRHAPTRVGTRCHGRTSFGTWRPEVQILSPRPFARPFAGSDQFILVSPRISLLLFKSSSVGCTLLGS